MNAYLSVVNQKLFFCKLLLNQGIAEEKKPIQLELALCQSALYQLECAYHHYLREIAATYQFNLAESIDSVEELASALESINKYPGEAQEILSLLGMDGSWLGQMLSAYQQLSLLPISESNITRSSLIAVVEVKQDGGIPSLNYQQLNVWHKAFVEMVDRHRELMVEC
ncbi:MAG: hypothetical protein COA46_02755 [Porticoccaceae bacterium]|nr:MAG: hypothetical protein COA46_02755 [Porticoccaceae bacterium]